MLRSDMEPRRKICGRGKKKPDPLEDLSSKHGYIRKKKRKKQQLLLCCGIYYSLQIVFDIITFDRISASPKFSGVKVLL